MEGYLTIEELAEELILDGGDIDTVEETIEDCLSGLSEDPTADEVHEAMLACKDDFNDEIDD